MKLFILKSFAVKSYTIIGLVFLISFFLIWVFYQQSTSEKNQEAYHRLVELAAPSNSNIKTSSYTANQQRQGGQKNIYYLQETERLEIQLSSKDSILVLDNQENGLEIIEKMQDVKCWMQEELYYLLADGSEAIKQSNDQFLRRNRDPKLESSWVSLQDIEYRPMQRLRYFEAEFATYFYNSEKLIAEQVKIFTYVIPFHTLPSSFSSFEPTMKGVARSVELSHENKTIKFTAQQLKATFFEQGKLL